MSFTSTCAPQLKAYDEFYQRIIHEGVNFIRGKVAKSPMPLIALMKKAN